MASRAGLLPEPLAGEIEGGLLTEDPHAQLKAAIRFTTIDDIIVEGGGGSLCGRADVFTFVSCRRATCLSKWASRQPAGG